MNQRRIGLLPALLVVLCAAAMGGGCAVATLVGGAAESYRRHSTRTVKAEYTGLKDRTFAVVVASDRMLQADFPAIVPTLTERISNRLAEHADAAGYVPAEDMLRYYNRNPRWPAMDRRDLAKDLGVEMLVIVEMDEFRLHEPGNRFLWDGLASGRVEVVEADAPDSAEVVFDRRVQVRFPDQEGFSSEDLTGTAVASALLQRFVDRSTWLFYDHQEPYYPDY